MVKIINGFLICSAILPRYLSSQLKEDKQWKKSKQLYNNLGCIFKSPKLLIGGMFSVVVLIIVL